MINYIQGDLEKRILKLILWVSLTHL